MWWVLFFLFQDINSKLKKVIPNEDRIFMSKVGPGASGKSHLIFQVLKKGTFVPPFDRFFYFYQYSQKLYAEMQEEVSNIEFIGGLDFIENLPNDRTNYLLIFDDSSDEISRSKQLEQIPIAGRHKKLNSIYKKHSLFHKSENGWDTELQHTHIVLFKSTPDVQQIDILGKQLGLGNTLRKWYADAVSIP